MIILKRVLFALILFTNLDCVSQTTDQIAQDRYWTYRNRLKKYFIKIGTYPGYSIPIYEHDIGKGDNSYYNGDYTTGNGANGGMIKFGDAPEAIGNYLILLATEYKLLKLEGKDAKETLNEIYYALNAINRLDETAEYYLSSTSSSPNKNGFLMRDDGPKNFYNLWLNEYNNTKDREDELSYFTGDAHKSDEPSGYLDPTNEMSQDHIIDLFTGFTFVKEMVDNVYVRPTSSDQGFYIIDEVKAITNRIMSYITALQPIHQSDYSRVKCFEKVFKKDLNQTWIDMGNACAPGDIRKNWVITDPVTGRLVERGPNVLLMAYPIATAATRITGTNWNNIGVRRKHVDQPFDGYSCVPYDFTLGLHSNDILADIWNEYPQHPQLFDPNDADPDWDFNITINGVTAHIKVEYNWLDALASGINDAVVRDNAAYMALSAACISNTWSHGHIKQHATNFGMYNYDLMFSVLNNDTPLDSKAFYESLLSSAPCDGPYNYNYPSAGTYDPFWNNSNVWVHSNYSENTPTTDQPGQGDHPGLDYMLLYNMYRIAFYNQISGQYSYDNSCPCAVNGTIKYLTDPANLNLLSNGTVYRKFSSDKNFSSYIKEYINKNLTISTSRSLSNATDLIICNNSIVTIENGGVLENMATNFLDDSIKIVARQGTKIDVNSNGLLDIRLNTKVVIQKNAILKANGNNAKIIVRNGGKLIIEPGAFLELNNGSKLIVEDGGQVIIQGKQLTNTTNENGVLTYNQGAEIQLKGDNAVLELNGRLHIGDNAVFKFTYPGSNSGYIKFNRGTVWWDNWAMGNQHITCGNNAKINLVGQSKTDKLIQINQNTCAIPKNLVQFTINKGLVEFTTNEARLESAVTTAYNNCTFKGVSSTPNGRIGKGVVMLGQLGFFANNCDFTNLGNGLTGALFYSGIKLTNVTSCNFLNCGYALTTMGAGVMIKNNNFFNNGVSINCGDVVNNSLIFNNTIDANYTYGSDILNEPVGIFAGNGNTTFEIRENTINNQNTAVFGGKLELKLKCNDLQSNSFALFGYTDCKINMSTLLGAGYNNASNCNQFAHFDEANYWESNQGFNSFKISNSSPCYTTNVGPGHPDVQRCPTITDGTLINFTSYNSTAHFYEQTAEFNFWKNLPGPLVNIEYDYNKLQKVIPAAPIPGSSPQYFDARLLSGTALINSGFTSCPNSGNGNGGNGNQNLPQKIHPLDDNSNCVNITTASFYNKRLQKALLESMSKMDNMQNDVKVNEAADLFTEILKVNYPTPVTNEVDKYLLELAYQKLYSCVAQLVEIHRDNGGTLNPIPVNLQTRFTDLQTIINLRLGRKATTDVDFKEINDLIYLDKAMVYRLAEQRTQAISVVDAIIASNPKAEHRSLYEQMICVYKTEEDALNGLISLEEVLLNMKNCNESYSRIQFNNTVSGARLSNQQKQDDEVVFGKEHAIAIYPNPTQGNLMIAYDLKDFSSITFEIFDVQGKSMLTKKLNPEEHVLNIENLTLENGVYFYNIIGDGKTLITKKLVVVK